MLQNSYLRMGILGGLFLIPFVPFVISSTMFFPFITGKTFAFRILAEVLFGAYLILALTTPEYRPKRSYLMWAVGSFVLFAGIATILSVDPIKSLWSNFERMEGYIGLLHLAAYFLVAGAMLSTEKLWTRFLQVSVGASALMGIYALFQIAGVLVINQGGVRVDGTFGNATYLAVYMLFHIFFTLYLLLREKALWVRGLYCCVLFLQATALFYTATRGALLGLIGGILLTALLIALFERERKGLRRGALGVIGGVLVLIGGFFLIKDFPAVMEHPVLTRFASISFTERTVESRFTIWGMALEGVRERPLFGWGQENFNFVFNKYYKPEMYAQEAWFDRAHNSFIDWLVAGGIPTFLAYVMLFILAVIAIFRSGLAFSEKAILIGLTAAYSFHLLFVFDNLISAVYFFTLLAFAHRISRNELPGSLWYARPLEGTPAATASLAILLATVGVVYVLNVPGIASAQALLKAITPFEVSLVNGQAAQVPKSPEHTLADFKDSLSSGPLGRQEAVEQLMQAATNASRANIAPTAKQAIFDYAYEQGEALLRDRPGDARLELFFGAFLNQWRRFDEGLAHLNRASELSPAKQGILMEIGVNSYLNAGNYTAAADVLKRAYELAPAYREARVIYAVALIYGGKKAEADTILMKHDGTLILDDTRLLKAYFDAKLFDRVVAIWQKRIEAEPLNLQVRVSLAAAYLGAGNRPAAIAAIREAIAIDPRFKAQGEGYIAEIQAGRNP